MLKSRLLHPVILETLAASGHGGKILIADGNYPTNTRANPGARRVYLNLAPGQLTVTDVLEVLVTAIPVEAADLMLTDSGEEPAIYTDFRRLLPSVQLQASERAMFYKKCFDPDVCLVIATGEQRLYANILLTIGVVQPS